MNLAGTPLVLDAAIEITGNGSTIDAHGLSRVFDIATQSGTTATLRGLTITGGSAGGINVAFEAGLVMDQCAISGNTTPDRGGGLSANRATVAITNSTFSSNSAVDDGGGLFFYNLGTAALTNVTVALNAAGRDGGGIVVTQSTEVTAMNCTITANLADSDNNGTGSGGGIFCDATLTLENTVVAGNEDTPGNAGTGVNSPDVTVLNSFSFHSLGQNFIGKNEGALVVFAAGAPNALGDYAGTSASPLNPGLTALPGRMLTYVPGQASLLIDHGDNTNVTATTDQRGRARIINSSVDIGAVEMGFLAVTNGNASGTGSLRTAITTANTQGGGDIFFGGAFFNVPRTIAISAGGELNPTAPIIITGPADPARRVTISGGNSCRIFKFTPAGAATFALSSLTLTSGDTAPYAGAERIGGGVYAATGATLMFSDVVVTGCNAALAGGGVCLAANAALFASDSTISANHAGTQGGGILNLGTVNLDRVTVNNNTANAEGGGLANAHNGTLTNCTFSNNRANSHGGAIYNLAAAADTLSLTHCTLTLNRSNDDNTGGGNGGGIRVGSGVVRVQNTVVSGNDALASAQDDISGVFTSQGHNLIGTASGGTGFTNGVNGDLIGANAYLGPLQNNGGPTFTHALLAGSAAIDAAASIAGSTDQRGLARSTTAPDMGAYELLTEAYAYWAAHTFPSATNAGANQDYDGDGFTNGFEFGAGSDALSAQSTPNVVTMVSGNNFVVEFTASALAPLGYDTLRYSTNLVTWQNVGTGLYQIVGANPAQNAVIFRVSVPQSFEPMIFFRLERLP